MNPAVAYLILITLWPGSFNGKHVHVYPSFEACQTALKEMKIVTPASAAENEWLAVAFCSHEEGKPAYGTHSKAP